MATDRPIVYLRLYRKPRAVAPPTPPPARVSREERLAQMSPADRRAYDDRLRGLTFDQRISIEEGFPSDFDATIAEDDAWEAREQARFERETKAAQREASIPLDISDKILSFRYEQTSRGADELKITIDNHDLSEFDNPAWKKKGILEVSWGYPGNMSPPRRMVIDKVRGGRELTIEAGDMRMLMHQEKRVRTFRDTNLRKLVEEVTGEYAKDFQVAIDDFPEVLNYHDNLRKMKGVPAEVTDEELKAFPEAQRKHYPLVSSLAQKWSQVFGVPIRMIFTIIRIESNFNPYVYNTNERAMSRGGAWGAMAMTLHTAIDLVSQVSRLAGSHAEVGKTLATWNGTGQSLIDPDGGADLNILLGVFMLGQLWKRFGADYQKVAAAYHSGSGPVLKAEKTGVHVTDTLGPHGKEYVRRADMFWKHFGGGGAAITQVAVPQVSSDVAAAIAKAGAGGDAVGRYLAARADLETYGQEGVDALEEARKTGKNAVSIYLGKKADQAKGIDAGAAEQVKLAQAHQSALTDAQFLSRMAKKFGFVFYVDHAGFVFEKIDEVYRQPPEKTLVWYHGQTGEFLDFTYENDGLGKPGRSKKKGVNPETGASYEVEGSNEATPRAGSGVRVSEGDTKAVEVEWDETTKRLKRMAAKAEQLPDGHPLKEAASSVGDLLEKGVEKLRGATTEDVGPTAAGDAGQAKAEVDGKHKAESSAQHQLTGKIIGDPSFRANCMMEVQGIGRRLSGKWMVKEVVHSIERSGYTCSFKAERDGDNGYGEREEADSRAEQSTAAAPPPEPKKYEWNAPSERVQREAVDAPQAWVPRDERGVPVR